MANYGLSRPWFAKYNQAANTYSGAFKCGKAMSTAVTPNYNTAALYADNIQSENVNEFRNATVTVGTDRLPKEASQTVFGHDVKEDGTEISNADDFGNYVGYGFITAQIEEGVKKFRSCVLLKVQFSEGEESFTTKGDSIVFGTPTLSGTAMAIETGEWREKSPEFDTETEAEDWIKTKLGVTDETEPTGP